MAFLARLDLEGPLRVVADLAGISPGYLSPS